MNCTSSVGHVAFSLHHYVKIALEAGSGKGGGKSSVRNVATPVESGTCCGAACMLPSGVVEKTEGGGGQWHAAWGGAAGVRTTDGSGCRRCEPWMAGAEQQQR
eukprot:2210247-Prymnesium_polylepis.1